MVTTNFHVVQTLEQLQEFESWALSNPTQAIDTETAPKSATVKKKPDVRRHSVNFRLSRLVGMSFSNGIDMFYIPVGHNTGEPQVTLQQLREVVQRIVEQPNFYPIYHNAKFDIKVITHCLGVDVSHIKCFDTYVAHWYFDQESPHKLKYLAKKILATDLDTKEIMEGVSVQYFTEAFDGERMDAKTVADVAEYAAKDAFFTFLLYKVFLKKLSHNPRFKKSFYNIHMPLLLILARAELRGITVDYDRLNYIREEMLKEKDEIEAKIFELVGYPFNINSTKTLSKILFDTLKLPPQKKTKAGKDSTGSKVLSKLIPYHEVCLWLVKYKKLQKRISAFTDPLIKLIDEGGSYIISPDFNICGARSGRLSCKTPNMQQIPANNEDEPDTYNIRSLFVPRPGYTFVVYDYSQLELRVLAHISGDKELRHAYQNDLDVHQRTADMLTQKTGNVINRKRGKNMQFAAVYGAAGQKLADMANEKLKPGEKAATREEMDDLIFQYIEIYSGVRDWKVRGEALIGKSGYVETLLGRRRFLPDYNNKKNHKLYFKALRSGINTKIQGSAADIVNLAMARIDEVIAELGALILLQVHDELIIETPIEQAEEVAKRVKNIMEHPFGPSFDLAVPLKAEGGVTPTWSH